MLKEPGGWGRIWIRPEGPDYFPLKSTLQRLEWQLWGPRTAGYHWVNLAFHVFAGWLLWRLLARWAGGWPGLLGGLLFVVHPLSVESVAWISELKNVLSLPLLLLSFLAYLDWEDGAGRAAAPYLAAVGCFLASLLCKTSVVMFPFVLLLHAWWRRGRVGRRDLVAAAPFFVASLVLGAVTIWFQHHRAIAEMRLPLGGPLWRAGSAALAVAFYLCKCLVPLRLMPIYPDWGGRPVWAGPTVCSAILLLGIVLLWRRRDEVGRAGLFGLGFFLLNLLPVLGFVPMSYLRISRVADHLCYLPLAGLVGLGAAALGAGRREWTPRRGVPALCLCAALAFASRNYAAKFADPLTFWGYAVGRNPQAWIAQNNFANALYDAGRTAEATEHYARAVGLRPDYAEAHNNFGNMLLNQGRIDAALEQYREALRIVPDYGMPQNGIGLALLRQGHPDQAIPRFELALRAAPDYAEPHYNLGLALDMLGRRSEAIAQYREALRLRPAYPEAMTDLANSLLAEDRRDEALALYRAALRINPAYAEAHYNLGVALYWAGDLAGAAEEFRATLRLRPGNAAARENLERALREMGR